MTSRPIEIVVKSGGTGASLTIRTLNPFGKHEASIAAGGIDPHSLNRIAWPIVGMSRWSTARVLMYRDDVDTLAASLTDGAISGGTDRLYAQLTFGTTTFPQMVVGKVLPVVTSEAGKALCVVEMHDRRYLWRHYRVQPSTGLAADDFGCGFNLVGFHRGRLRRDSLNADAPWNPKEIVEFIRDENGSQPYDFAYVAANDEWDDTDTSSYYVDNDCCWDINGDDSFAGAIDKVLAKCGHVMTVVPKLAAPAGLSFGVRAIDDEHRANLFYAAKTDELLAGGLDFLSADETPPASGAAKWAYVNKDIVRRDCPLKVRVYFPLCVADGSDDVLKEIGRDFDVTGISSTADRASLASNKSAMRTTWETDIGRPSFVGSSPFSPSIYHINSDFPLITKHNLLGADLIDTTDTALRADQASSVFYARYKAGCGDGFFRDTIQPLKTQVWAGAQWWELSLVPHPTLGMGRPIPLTRVWGDRHCGLFGYHPLSEPERVQGFGTVHAFRGPDGSIKVVGQQIGGIPVRLRFKSATPKIDPDTELALPFQFDYTATLMQYDGGGEWVEGELVDVTNAMEHKNTSTFVAPSTKWPLDVPGTWQVLALGIDRDGVFHEFEADGRIYENRNAIGPKAIEVSIPLTIDGGCDP